MQLPRQLHNGLSSVLACCVRGASLGTLKPNMLEMCESQRSGVLEVGVAKVVCEDASSGDLGLGEEKVEAKCQVGSCSYRKGVLLDATSFGRRFSFMAMQSWKAEHHVGLDLLEDPLGVKRGMFGLMGDGSSLKDWVIHGSTGGDILYTCMVSAHLIMTTGVAIMSTSKTDVAILKVATRMQMV